MLIPDANLLIYAHHEQSPFFKSAREWLRDALTDSTEVGIPAQSILAFLRITTNPNLRTRAVPLSYALQVVESWLSQPHVSILSPGPAHWSIFKHFCLDTGIGGKLTTDAHLAALAMEHNGTLLTADTDFARFPGLRWRNPLLRTP